MVAFKFKIRPAFLQNGAHPISVPKRYRNDSEFHGLQPRSRGVGFPTATVLTPWGEMPGSIGLYGEQRRIQVRGATQGDAIEQFEPGEIILVEICRFEQSVRVTLSQLPPPEPSEQIERPKRKLGRPPKVRENVQIERSKRKRGRPSKVRE
jgi:hypothetical protein